MPVQGTDDLTYYVDNGVISELNRLYLHPRGLALIGDAQSGRLTFQYTADEYGWTYDTLLNPRIEDQGEVFDALLLPDRESALGWVIQPLPEGS